MRNGGSLFKAILLVAGTSIGGGMLALPVLTSQAGFLPSLLIYTLCWLFMASTGLLLFESCLWMGKNANLVSISERTLGWPGKWFSWGLYLFLFYCLTLAYIVGCGNLVVEASNGSIPEWGGALLFVILFFPIIFAGTRAAGRLNTLLMGGLVLSYLAFVLLGYEHVRMDQLAYREWVLAPAALPIAFTAFSYQGIIPTLVNYLDHDKKRIKRAIFIGSFIPLIVYAIWEALILGIVPFNHPQGLAEALNKGQNAVYPLRYFINSPYVYGIGQFFAFFALVTSFIGVTLGLMDFLSDGLKMDASKRRNKLLLSLLIFVPPLLIALTHPGLFLKALDYAGGYGCALLLGLLPVLIVWSGRYRLNLNQSQDYQLPGGKPLLALLILFVLFEVGCQFLLTK